MLVSWDLENSIHLAAEISQPRGFGWQGSTKIVPCVVPRFGVHLCSLDELEL